MKSIVSILAVMCLGYYISTSGALESYSFDDASENTTTHNLSSPNRNSILNYLASVMQSALP